MAAIKIEDLRKVYRVGESKVVALDHITMEMEPGEITGILGTSGSGKTTLLNMIAGLEKPTKGNIEMFGYDIVKLNERQLARFRQHYVGFIFQSYNLLTALTALENVALPLIFRGVERSKRERMAMKMLEAVGLKKHALHKPTQLSGGQQQRVGIARAFVIRPKVIFADEPTGNLDSRTTKEVMELMMEITRENGQNLVLVTHDSNIAGYADRIVHIMDGKIQQSQLIKRG